MGLAAVLVVFRIGCAQKIAVRRTAEVPAALAEAKITKTDNNNTRIELEVQHLAPPQNLVPKKSVYVVWAQAPQGRTINLGQMIVGQDRASEFIGITPLKEFRIIVTAEELPATATPSSQVVLSTEVFRVS
ncbi:MAG: hypothetical protein ACREQO_20560 [Candidatus Binatia bacterium]